MAEVQQQQQARQAAEREAERERLAAEQKERARLAALRAEREVEDRRRREAEAERANDADPPVIRLADERIETEADSVLVKGSVADKNAVRLRLRGDEVALGDDGAFEHRVHVTLFESTLTLVATDAAGNRAKREIEVYRALPAPSPPQFDPLEPWQVAGEARPEAVALIVGVEAYDRLPDVGFAKRDAVLFYDYAKHALGIPPSNIVLVEEPTENNVKSAIERRLKRLIRRGQSDVYLFFAGHGLVRPGEEPKLYLLTSDSDPANLRDTALGRDDTIERIMAAEPASLTLFLDTCYSGVGRGGERIADTRSVPFLPPGPPGPVAVLSAASGVQVAEPLAAAEHGLFSYFLMRGLGGEADENEDKAITSGELHAYLQAEVPRAASHAEPQQPQLHGDEERVLVRLQ